VATSAPRIQSWRQLAAARAVGEGAIWVDAAGGAAHMKPRSV